MPFLRVIRDKRGYETTYLMHWFNEGGRQRSRILYAFRGPAATRVGRLALEPAVMRHLEATFPDVVFDWKAVPAVVHVARTARQRRREPKPCRRRSCPPRLPPTGLDRFPR